MPTYQYSCTECGHFFEQFQSFSDSSLTECPSCTGALRKVFNAVGVVFKGSGFYRNDSRPAASSAESGSSADGATKSSTESTPGTSKSSADGGSSAKPAATSSPGSSPKAPAAAS